MPIITEPTSRDPIDLILQAVIVGTVAWKDSLGSYTEQVKQSTPLDKVSTFKGLSEGANRMTEAPCIRADNVLNRFNHLKSLLSFTLELWLCMERLTFVLYTGDSHHGRGAILLVPYDDRVPPCFICNYEVARRPGENYTTMFS